MEPTPSPVIDPQAVTATLRKPALKIGPYQVDPPVVLAPMAGITNVASRQLCAEYGAGIYALRNDHRACRR